MASSLSCFRRGTWACGEAEAEVVIDSVCKNLILEGALVDEDEDEDEDEDADADAGRRE